MKASIANNLLHKLKDGAHSLNLTLDNKQCDQLIAYIAMLEKWNGVYNLTAVRDPERMVTQHLLDCLAALPAFEFAASVLDVGSGGGLPGLVLTIARPDLEVEMIDSVQKKTAFLMQAKLELSLSNAVIRLGKVEEMKAEKRFDAITSRAFSGLGEFIALSGHLLAEKGRFIAMKGAVPQKEIDELKAPWRVTEIMPVAVPGLGAERNLIIVERVPA